MFGHLFGIFEPLAHSIVIKSQIPFIGLAFIIWCLVGPYRIFFKSITHSHGMSRTYRSCELNSSYNRSVPISSCVNRTGEVISG